MHVIAMEARLKAACVHEQHHDASGDPVTIATMMIGTASVKALREMVTMDSQGPKRRREGQRVAPARSVSPAIEFFKGQQTESSNHMQTFALNALAEQFECDRSTMVRAMRGVPPDLVKRGNRPQWKVATASRALEAHRRKQGNGNVSSKRDPDVELLSDEFEDRLAALRKLPALEDRRAAARALAPLIDEVGRATRAVGHRNGNGGMADLISDQMMMLMTRGFCEPCEWNSDEAFSAGMMPDDEDA